MPLFRASKVIERQIDEFLDTINEGALVFKHCDGNVIPIVDRFLSAPIDMLVMWNDAMAFR